MSSQFLAASLALVIVTLPAFAAERFAIVLGNNSGASERPKLWFAERDAERFAHALTELGEFSVANVRLQKGGTRAALVEAFTQTEVAMKAARASGSRTLLVFYFSGHAGGSGLELGSEAIAFAQVRALVEGASADVKVAFVDACESGALTQVKGAKTVSSIDFPLPTEDSAKGVAYIASTAVGEAAQESAKLGGSFFTFHLETALRGAGDSDHDGQVTLAEAFHYTASRTISTTSSTSVGPQHPTYDFRMAGRGDVVLSDLRRADATMTLTGDSKTSYVISNAQGVVAESPGGTRLGLPAGRYRVEKRSGGAQSVADVSLLKGDSKEANDFAAVSATAARSKGGALPFELFAGVNGSTAALSGQTVLPGVRVGVQRVAFGEVLLRLRFDYNGGPGQDNGLQYSLHRVSGALAALYPLYFFDSRLRLDVGLEAGLFVGFQTLSNGRNYQSTEGLGALTTGLRYAFSDFFVAAQASGGVRAFTLNSTFTYGFRVDGALVFGVRL